jgi:hypothetical protein
MAHPLLGLPPSDPTVGHPEAAARLRAQRSRVGRLAMEAALRIDPTLGDRHDDLALRRLLRDLDRHVEQLARALETGEERFVVQYAEWLVPVYRRRHVRMKDLATIIDGLGEATLAVLPARDAPTARAMLDAWVARLRHHRRLPGDHRGNAMVRFIWKGAGLGDDTVV